MFRKQIGDALFGDNMLKIGNGQVVVRLGKYIYYRNMRGNEAMGIIYEYCKFLKEERGELGFADAIQTMVLAGCVSGVFSDKMGIVGFTDCGGELVEIDGVDYDAKNFADWFYGKATRGGITVGFGLGLMVKEKGVTIYD